MSETKLYTTETKDDLVTYSLNEIYNSTLEEYFALDFYGTKVPTPYYINTKRRKDLRALVGKGSAQEIVLETKVWAQVHNLDLQTASVKEIRELMLRVGIGIDCSGLVVHALASYCKNVLGKNLFAMLKYTNNSFKAKLARYLRPVENVGANELTSELNCGKPELNSVLPGDLIRGIGKQRNAYHVAVITKVVKQLNSQGTEQTTRIFYTHSHRQFGEDNGVRKGEIEVTDSTADLVSQNWLEVYKDGHNYLYEEVSFDPEDSGLRRLFCV